MAKQDGWRNRLSDGITIVLSILAAFALDSWWDNYTITRNVENGIQAVAEELVDVVAHLDQRLAGALYTPTIDPPTGALVTFIDSGLLTAVVNKELRHQIGELPSRIDDGADDELSALGYVDENVRPTLERSLSSADFSAVLRQMPHYWASFRSDVPWAEPSVSVSVFASRELHNAIASRLQMMEFARVEVRDLQQSAATTLAMTGY